MSKFVWFVLVAATAAVTLFVFRKWGLTGSVVLMGLWGLFVLGISIRQRRLQALIRKKLANMSEVERVAALSADERAEVMSALKGRNK